MSTYQQERLAVETRLQQLSTCQHERLAFETPAERETRLQRYSVKYREQSAQAQLPLFLQYSIQAKICKFHASMDRLDAPVCMGVSNHWSGM